MLRGWLSDTVVVVVLIVLQTTDWGGGFRACFVRLFRLFGLSGTFTLLP